MSDLERAVRDLCASAREHGQTMINVSALERLVDTHQEYARLGLHQLAER